MNTERSEIPERRTAFVARELRQYKIDIAALQEIRRGAGKGHLTEKGAGYRYRINIASSGRGRRRMNRKAKI